MPHNSFNMSRDAHRLIENGCLRLEAVIDDLAAKIATQKNVSTVVVNHIRNACRIVALAPELIRECFDISLEELHEPPDIATDEEDGMQFDLEALHFASKRIQELQKLICEFASAIVAETARTQDGVTETTDDSDRSLLIRSQIVRVAIEKLLDPAIKPPRVARALAPDLVAEMEADGIQ